VTGDNRPRDVGHLLFAHDIDAANFWRKTAPFKFGDDRSLHERRTGDDVRRLLNAFIDLAPIAHDRVVGDE
jgi:hypothetical protein